MVLDVNGNRLDAKFLGSTGDIQDDFTILKLPEVSGSVAENTAAGEGSSQWRMRTPRTT